MGKGSQRHGGPGGRLPPGAREGLGPSHWRRVCQPEGAKRCPQTGGCPAPACGRVGDYRSTWHMVSLTRRVGSTVYNMTLPGEHHQTQEALFKPFHKRTRWRTLGATLWSRRRSHWRLVPPARVYQTVFIGSHTQCCATVLLFRAGCAPGSNALALARRLCASRLLARGLAGIYSRRLTE